MSTCIGRASRGSSFDCATVYYAGTYPTPYVWSAPELRGPRHLPPPVRIRRSRHISMCRAVRAFRDSNCIGVIADYPSVMMHTILPIALTFRCRRGPLCSAYLTSEVRAMKFSYGSAPSVLRQEEGSRRSSSHRTHCGRSGISQSL